MFLKIETTSADETYKLACGLAKKAKSGEVYCLCGDLGSGKTVFAKGFAEGLEIDEHITSPTFTLMNEYNGKLMLYHFDLYRIENADELDELGFEEFFYGEGVCLVEWPENAKGLMPKNAVWVTFERDINKEDYRKITIKTENKNDTFH